MSLIEQAKALLERAAKRTRTGPLTRGNTEPFAVWIKDPNALGGMTLGERLLLRFNQHIPFADDIAYLVAVWDLAEVLAREYIVHSEMLNSAALAMTAEWERCTAAIQRARREERQRCIGIVAEYVDHSCGQAAVVARDAIRRMEDP